MRSSQDSQQQPENLNGSAWGYVAVASCLAAALALLFLDAKSFWLDEAWSVEYANPYHSLAQVGLANGGNFSVYYLLLHVWLRFGTSDAFVRALSVIPAVLAVPCVFILGRRLLGAPSAAIAAFALALNPFFIAYAQEARGYSLFLLASIVAMLFFVRLIQQPESRANLLVYVAVNVVMVYTHLFGMLVLAAQAVALLFFDKRSVPWRKVAVAAPAIALLLLPLAYVAHRQGTANIAWIPQVTSQTVGGVFEALAGGLPLLIFYVALAGYASLGFRNRGGLALPKRPALVLILTWLFLPVVLAIVLSKFVTPIVVARYFISCLAPLALLAGALLWAIRDRAIFATASILFVALSALGLWHYYFHVPKEDWRGTAAYVLANSKPGDTIVCNPPWTVVALRHAIVRMPEANQSPDLVARSPLNPNHVVDAQSVAVRSFVTTLNTHPRVWLILSGHDLAEGFQHNLAAQSATVEEGLRSRKRLLMKRSFADIDVRLFGER